MLREPSLTLAQAAIMYRNIKVTQQQLRQFKNQHNDEEEEGSDARRNRQDGYQPRRNQTDDSGRKRHDQCRKDLRRGGEKKACCRHCGGKGNRKPQNITQHQESDGEFVERRRL